MANLQRKYPFSFSLKIRKKFYVEAEKRLNTLLGELDINLPLSNYVYQLSGGQQQLTAILRILIYEPEVFLLDEPFSALDLQTRRYMQDMLLKIWSHYKPTILFVSHDLEELYFLLIDLFY
jgi:NitT/TauT family transport system ATP-binding protein